MTHTCSKCPLPAKREENRKDSSSLVDRLSYLPSPLLFSSYFLLLSHGWGKRPNYSAPGAPSGLANVTFQLYDDIYIYDARTLWFAYGIAIFFTAVIVVIGCTAMWLNGVAYESSFSTVLRASWIYITGTAEDGGGPEVDDGSMPKPAYLTNAIVVMGAASRDPNYPSTPPHDHDEIPLVNHPIGENTS